VVKPIKVIQIHEQSKYFVTLGSTELLGKWRVKC